MENLISRRKYWLAVLSVCATIALSVLIIHHREYVDQMSHWGYFGLFLVNVVASGTLVLPGMGAVLTFTLGGVLHPAIVGLVSGFGETTGAVGAYLTGYGGRGFLASDPLRGRLSEFMQRHGSKTMFFMAAIFNPIYYPFAVWMGVLRIRVTKFFIYTLLGRTVKNLILAYFGYYGLRTVLRWVGMDI